MSPTHSLTEDLFTQDSTDGNDKSGNVQWSDKNRRGSEVHFLIVTQAHLGFTVHLGSTTNGDNRGCRRYQRTTHRLRDVVGTGIHNKNQRVGRCQTE